MIISNLSCHVWCNSIKKLDLSIFKPKINLILLLGPVLSFKSSVFVLPSVPQQQNQ